MMRYIGYDACFDLICCSSLLTLDDHKISNVSISADCANASFLQLILDLLFILD